MPSLTPNNLQSATPAIDDDALLAPLLVAASQPQSTPDAQLEADTRFQRSRNPLPYLDNYFISPVQQPYNVKCAKLLESQSSICDTLHTMRSNLPPHLLDVHSSQQLNHVVSQQSNKNYNDDITIGFNNSSDESVPFAVSSYSYMLRRASRIMFYLSLFHVAGLALLFVPRDAGVGYRDNIYRINAAIRERALCRMSTPLAITFAFRREQLTPGTAPGTLCAALSI